jgi:hypothetical protein
MQRAMQGLHDKLAEQRVAATGDPMAVYLRTHAAQRTTSCRFAIPIGEATVEQVGVATLPAHRAFVATLEGSREQLEIAWYLAMQRLGDAGLRPDLRLAPTERYLRGSIGGPGNDPITELRIPVL